MLVAVVAQLVEHKLPKLGVTSSNLAYRSVDNQGCKEPSSNLFLLGVIIIVAEFGR